MINCSYGCDSSDHRACDEICKQDSFWYGHCITWDGRDFSCKCHEYRPPLDKTPCLERQQSCKGNYQRSVFINH
uniref:Uncharacterized protein n=1 Tax=Parascaris equorum TaxID=6256 RepID=A0A914S2A7_PAREQ